MCTDVSTVNVKDYRELPKLDIEILESSLKIHGTSLHPSSLFSNFYDFNKCSCIRIFLNFAIAILIKLLGNKNYKQNFALHSSDLMINLVTL